MALDAGLFEPGMGQPGYGQDISLSLEEGSAEANRITAGLLDGSLIGDGRGGVMESGIAPTITPDPPSNTQGPAPSDPFSPAPQEGTDVFDYTQTDGQWEDIYGSSRTSPYGPNTGDQESEFVSWYNPHGGQTFIGVRADGTKEFVDQSTAVSLGYESPDVMGGPPGGPWDEIITPGETYNPGDGGGGGGGGGGSGGGSGSAPGTGTQPPPTGDGSTLPWAPGMGADQSWSWDYFQPKSPGAGEWGGYDQDYGVFERYQPGQDSPWGMPDIEGGNKEFYQQQFNNLLRDEQGFQNRERAAQLRGYENSLPENQSGPINYEDMWGTMGITPSQAAQGAGDNMYTWDLLSGIEKGKTSNRDYFNTVAAQGGMTTEDKKRFGELWDAPSNEGFADKFGWSRRTDPQDGITQIDPNMNPAWNDRLSKMFNQAFTRSDITTPVGGGPTASPGYALPVAGSYGGPANSTV